MMKSLYLIIAMTILGFLVGCSDSPKSKIASSPGDGGIEGTGDKLAYHVASGVVTGFGSVYVDGVHFDTRNAEVYFRDLKVPQDQLQTGMYVEITGTMQADHEGVAQRIDFSPILRGRVSHVIPVSSTTKDVIILGQTVRVSQDAFYSNINFDDLRGGVNLEVSGFILSNGTPIATRIEKVADNNSFITITGLVDEVDLINGRIRIGNQWVKTNPQSFSGINLDSLKSSKIEVDISDISKEMGDLQAIKIEKLVKSSSKPHKSFLLEGVIEQILDVDKRLIINGVQVDITRATFAHGSSALLTTGTQLSIMGAQDDEGLFNASHVHILSTAFNRIRAPIEAIDSASGDIKVLGVSLKTDLFTAYRDLENPNNRYFHFSQLRTGDAVDLYVTSIGDQLVVRRLEKVAPTTEVFITGSIAFFPNETTVKILGITVDLIQLASPALFNQLGVNDRVSIKGLAYPSKVRALDIQIDPDSICTPTKYVRCY